MQKLVRINQVSYDKDLFKAWQLGSAVDQMFSVGGGIPRATNWMVTGDPGVGKSTVMCDILADAAKNGSKVLFISGEMNQVDLYLYVERYPKFGTLDIFFPQDVDDCPMEAIMEVLNQGWDIVMLDSFIEVQEIIKEAGGMSTKASEKWMLDLMADHNAGKNTGKHYTSFLNIQQMTKGGTFVGSNRLKHMTTGMMEIRFVDENEEDRYIVFSKNRRGHVGKRLYFDLSSPENVIYDQERFKKTEELHMLKKRERLEIKNGTAMFDELFKLTSDETDEN
jgi:DNA repair protein RadA/Sms